jgi:hypothetical protein
MLLCSTFECLKDAFPEIDPEHIALLSMKAKSFKARKNFYYQFIDDARAVENFAKEVVQLTYAMADTLKEVKRDEGIYKI